MTDGTLCFSFKKKVAKFCETKVSNRQVFFFSWNRYFVTQKRCAHTQKVWFRSSLIHLKLRHRTLETIYDEQKIMSLIIFLMSVLIFFLLRQKVFLDQIKTSLHISRNIFVGLCLHGKCDYWKELLPISIWAGHQRPENTVRSQRGFLKTTSSTTDSTDQTNIWICWSVYLIC